MARADPYRTKSTTKLAAMRVRKGYGQVDVARATGMSDRTYQRLEAGELPNPGIRSLVACAIALDCPLEALIEDEWLVFWTEETDGSRGKRAAAAVHPKTGAKMARQRLNRS